MQFWRNSTLSPLQSYSSLPSWSRPLSPQRIQIRATSWVIEGYEDTPYGVLEIDSPTQHAYDEHDINFLTGFANVLAEAVATQRRMHALRMLVEEKNLLAQ